MTAFTSGSTYRKWSFYSVLTLPAHPGYKEVIGKLQKGDTLVIKSLDRLGRNFDEILEQWRLITVEKQAGIIILDIPLLGDLNKDLMGRVVAQLMLTLMSYMAETERRTPSWQSAVDPHSVPWWTHGYSRKSGLLR